MRRKTLRSNLIERDLVSKSIFTFIDVAHDNLTIDSPPVLVKNIMARVQNNKNGLIEDVEKMIRDVISFECEKYKESIIES